MRGRFRRWILTASVVLGALVACNQLVGVNDVVLKQQSDSGDDDDSGPFPPGDDDDSGPVIGDSSIPVTPYPALGLGFDHTCARLLDSTVKCWGQAFNG